MYFKTREVEEAKVQLKEQRNSHFLSHQNPPKTMATPLPIPTTVNPYATAKNLFAAVDMGTNSFKLILVRADPTTGKFLALDRLKEPVVLGRDATAISAASQHRAIDALRKFQQVLHSQRVSPAQTRLVATSAVREASNQSEFVHNIHQTLGLDVDVLSGEEEARLVYTGVLQFHPVFHQKVLTIDIGGGSTEFVIGKEGKVIFGISLKLGHVTLTQEFVNNNELSRMREHIRTVVRQSGLIEKVGERSFDVVIGSSGTIKGIERAIFSGYGDNLMEKVGLFEGNGRDWRFSREELGCFVDRLCGEGDGNEGKVRRERFFKRRSEFIVAGAVLLEEIFGILGITEMEVSGYALGEGVIAEQMAETSDGYDVNANARWRSVVGLATRFNNKKRMKSAALCSGIAKEIFEGLRKFKELSDDQHELVDSLDDKDLEYLEAACLLHNIGIYTGKKGYHKQSYHIILNGDHLRGYNTEEVELIALLVRHHRKKFPKLNHSAFQRLTKEARKKFKILCVIIRISVVVQHYHCVDIQGMEFSHSDEGFKLVPSKITNQPSVPGLVQTLADDVGAELTKELEHFREVFQQKLSIVVPSSPSEPSRT